jgi:hypothetical protein
MTTESSRGLLFVALAGCADHQAIVRQRFSFDFNCPPPRIEVRDLGHDTMGVTGCGQRATYVSMCGGYGSMDCKWVLNNSR